VTWLYALKNLALYLLDDGTVERVYEVYLYVEHPEDIFWRPVSLRKFSNDEMRKEKIKVTYRKVKVIKTFSYNDVFNGHALNGEQRAVRTRTLKEFFKKKGRSEFCEASLLF
jgi:hypothetical protein